MFRYSAAGKFRPTSLARRVCHGPPVSRREAVSGGGRLGVFLRDGVPAQRLRDQRDGAGRSDTGCLDLETNGTIGYNKIFNGIVPRGGATLRTPVPARSIGGGPMCLTSRLWAMTPGRVRSKRRRTSVKLAPVVVGPPAGHRQRASSKEIAYDDVLAGRTTPNPVDRPA